MLIQSLAPICSMRAWLYHLGLRIKDKISFDPGAWWSMGFMTCFTALAELGLWYCLPLDKSIKRQLNCSNCPHFPVILLFQTMWKMGESLKIWSCVFTLCLWTKTNALVCWQDHKTQIRESVVNEITQAIKIARRPWPCVVLSLTKSKLRHCCLFSFFPAGNRNQNFPNPSWY